MASDAATNRPNKNNVNVLRFQTGFYLRMIFLLCSAAQAVWDFLRRDPSRPTQPVNSDAHGHVIVYHKVEEEKGLSRKEQRRLDKW